MSNLQLTFNFKKHIWSAPNEYKDLSQYDEIAIDLETCDEGIRDGKGAGWATSSGYVIGFAVAVEGWQGYFPFAHFGGGNLIKEQVIKYMKSVCSLPATKIFHNAQYDVGWLRAMGIEVKGEIVDTMIAGALIDENRFSYTLNSLSKDYLGELKAETGLVEAAQQHGVDPKGEMWKLPAEHVGFYAEQDARLTLMLWQRFKTEIYTQSLETIWQLEKSLLPILIQMRETGIRVDMDRTVEMQFSFKKQEQEILRKIKKLVGQDVDIWAARQIGFAFDKLGIEYPRTKTDEPSFTQAWLNNNPNEISKLIVQAREVNKFHNTFISSILKYEHKGRIHSEIRQIKNDQGGTVSGRLAMSNPNLQQLPARSKEFGPLIRGLFLPEEGCQWGSFDYSQQEPRLVVHYAASVDEGLHGSEELVEAYANADADFHQTVADLVGIERKQAKTIGLGLMYGMGKNKLGGMLGLDTKEANDLIAQYNNKVPFVKLLSDKCMQKASSEGIIRTKLGRKCRFDMWEPKDFGIHTAERFENASAKYGANNIKRAFTYKALNRLIQGSAADQTKQAVVDCHKEGLTPMLQIHDELCFSITKEEEIKKITKIMETCVDLKVPSVVDVALGKDFGEAS
jgi:DNA polymerase I-like protein with 3'-5' exonuclease and polymerase domains|tara:strand:+ start:1542 stop:3410 length:1869 start_codon:yes stop_codon:yes gene_type:complete